MSNVGSYKTHLLNRFDIQRHNKNWLAHIFHLINLHTRIINQQQPFWFCYPWLWFKKVGLTPACLCLPLVCKHQKKNCRKSGTFLQTLSVCFTLPVIEFHTCFSTFDSSAQMLDFHVKLDFHLRPGALIIVQPEYCLYRKVTRLYSDEWFRERFMLRSRFSDYDPSQEYQKDH